MMQTSHGESETIEHLTWRLLHYMKSGIF
ncbi:hypothetical protein LINPERHAP1_LOCUS364 [Linum perenne]